MQFATDTVLQEKIRQAIIGGHVSVYKVSNGDLLECTDYSVTGKDGTTYNFEQLRLFEDKGKIFYQYTISINDQDVADVIIADTEKTTAQPAIVILKFFQMCSTKLIYQEMQNTIHKLNTPNNFKTLN